MRLRRKKFVSLYNCTLIFLLHTFCVILLVNFLFFLNFINIIHFSLKFVNVSTIHN
jgi:hypothetical protein